jgi:hypothetical protein
MSRVYGMTLRTITEAGMPVEKTSNHLQVKAKTIASWTESCKNLLTKASQQVTLYQNKS